MIFDFFFFIRFCVTVISESATLEPERAFPDGAESEPPCIPEPAAD